MQSIATTVMSIGMSVKSDTISNVIRFYVHSFRFVNKLKTIFYVAFRFGNCFKCCVNVVLMLCKKEANAYNELLIEDTIIMNGQFGLWIFDSA